MKTKKLLKALEELFDKETGKKREQRDQLQALLVKLHEKKDRLENKVRKGKDGREGERLERKLAIVKAQIEKGEESLRDIKAGLGES